MAFDVEMATQAYMATLSGAARAKSDAYFEGGYWLIAWDFLVTILANGAVLHLGWAARLSAWAKGRAKGGFGRAFLFAVPYVLLVTAITLPFTIYTDFFREHQYGLSNQSFGAWAGEAGIGLAINTIVLALLWGGIHCAIRRSPKGWWLAGTGITVIGMTIAIAIAPVAIAPLFNDYVPLPDGPVKQAVLAMARANGVPADNVYLVDASRQSDRISANVQGLGATTRISLNDNLMKQDLAEIRAVMGHELGHYVLNHAWKMLLALVLITAAAFLIIGLGMPWLVARFGARWGIADLNDPAVLGAAMLVLAGVSVVLSPAMNTLIRTQEQEADVFGLNAARAPDGFARIAMKLSQYRKIEPGAAEEAIFFDHPSGHTRVLTAMRWKAEHLDAPDVK
ncbi:M48 family metalloprotease [Sandarakinorhabdus sp.]|uniref:M48 family metalloprotease n=1 Tax=Sandarakinorhabdus sp. TaxID=1916663 RepID=UPI00286E5D4D|nr:M48 family metalloprotease [Sandarakinorhabdus sp.]